MLRESPYTAADVKAQLTRLHGYQQTLSDEVRSTRVAAYLKDTEVSALFSNSELQGLVEVDLPANSPDTIVIDNKTYMPADSYYLQVAQARHDDLVAYDEQLIRQSASDPTTQRSLAMVQANSAQAGSLNLLATMERLKAAGDCKINQDKVNRAHDLLSSAANAASAVPAEPVLAATHPSELAEIRHGSAIDAEKKIARLQHKGMQYYLGVKHPSASEKEAAVQHFRNELDRYLEGRRGQNAELHQPPALVGPDLSPSGALTPNEKVSLLIARTLENAVDVNGMSNAQRALFKELSNPKGIRKQLIKDLQQNLRARFGTINKSISLPSTNRQDPTRPMLETYQTELKPAIDNRYNLGENGVLSADQRPFGDTGVLCSDTHSSRHVPNLWSVDYTGPNGNTLFSGVRHGTLSAYGISARSLKALPTPELHKVIKDTLPQQLEHHSIEHLAKKMTSRFSLTGSRLRTEARKNATMERARELVKFNLFNNKEAMEKVRAGLASTETEHTVELDLPSIMLITPDRGRRLLGALGIKNAYDELRMTREQDAALKELAVSGVTMPFKYVNENGKSVVRNVTVKPRPLNFSFGVNKLAFDKTINRLSPSWSNADAISRSSIERLVGKDARPGQRPTSGLVAEYLDRLPHNGAAGDHRKEAAILQLTDQVIQIWQSKSHHRQSNEPYALPTRLALLSHEIGLTPGFNCKSGKDRTGQLDAEIKYLATRIERGGGQVPEPGADLSHEEQEMYRTIVLNSGNHEIQALNTGQAGYKVKLSSITRRLGGVLAQLQHLGQGKFVST